MNKRLSVKSMFSEYHTCPHCGDWHAVTESCAEEYRIVHDDECQTVRGRSFDDAAENYAMRYNDEMDLIDETIMITVEKNGIEKVFKCSAEIMVNYSIDELT